MKDASWYQQRINLLDDELAEMDDDVIDDEPRAVRWPVVRWVTAPLFFGAVLYVQGWLLALYVERGHPMLGVAWIMLMIMATLTAAVWSLYNVWRR